ncbi:hypothetical protein [Niveispirillum sp. KHB5.9]|uniref:hypothetical protein n=1 Tax=Niveispirillum sp. KHB5.9 TaxID=3400269 RepID=UPI003A84151E
MSRVWLWRSVVTGAILVLPVAGALAQVEPAAVPTPTTGVGSVMAPDMYTASVQALTKLAVIAIVLEQALALIFDWKLFRETFDNKAVKPLVSLLFAAAIVHEFSLDVVATLITAYGGDQTSIGFVSKLVTALVLAGGSTGINNILRKLGVRTGPDTPDEPVVAPTQAFVAIVPVPKAKDNLSSVTVVGVDSTGTAHSLGTVAGNSVGRDPKGLGAWFLQEKGRFPRTGGFALAPGHWSIRLDAVDNAGNASSSAVWGPYQLDAGTRIDLTLKV